MESVFSRLNAINVNDHTELKGRLTYLSWAWAWAEVKKLYPDAQYTVYERPDGVIYWTDGKTCWVKTGLTINGLEHIEYLPIMDARNQSIPLERVNSMDVNKAIQRSLTKAAARHGLGLYIYAGEDLPEIEAEAGADKPKQGTKEAAEAVGRAKLEAMENDVAHVQASAMATPEQKEQILRTASPEDLSKIKARYGEDLSNLSRFMADRVIAQIGKNGGAA